MAYNKIDANGETLIDLTSDTVTADTIVSGRTAHLASGEKVTGTFEPVTGVKGNAESTYRKGDVNLTPANIGAATSAQGTKADSAVQTIQIGGTTQTKTNGTVNLPSYPTKSSLGLDNLGYYGIGGRTTNTTTNPWVLVAKTTASNSNNTGITLLFDYTYTPANNATSAGTGILSVSVRTDANGAIITNRSYAKWLTKMSELNNDDVIITYNNSTKSLQIWGKSDYPYKVFRVRPLSGSDIYSSFDISKWTFTASLNTNMYASYPTGDGITVLIPTCDIQDQLDDLSGELDCLLIQAALVNNEVIIQNTSDFTDELYFKYFSYTKPKFAILELQATSNTYYYKALINSLSVRQGNLMDASFITANGTYMNIYNFNWYLSSTVGPTVSYTSLNLGS